MDLEQRVAQLEYQLRNLAVRSQHAVKPGRQMEPTDETGVIQGLRLRHNSRETRDLSSMQLFGFASVTLPGADLMTVQVSGDNSNGMVIASNDQRYRPKHMNAGSTRIYDANGDFMQLDAGAIVISTIGDSGNVAITTKGTVTITAPNVHVTGDIHTDGDVVAGTVSLKNHAHRGVSTGSGNSGVPNT